MKPQMNQCPKCSKELSPALAGGLCPSCLLEQGLQATAAGESAIAPTSDDARAPSRSSRTASAAMAGERVGRYKLLQVIGEGGFGTVYMAEQETPVRRRVALKIIKLGMDTKAVIARFEAERQALAMMDHPNIAKVLDAGATDTGRPYFVMELVNGVPVTEYCDANRLTARERLELFVPICQAVHHAHQKGIIHRDLKPSNVMVTLHDGKPMPKVIDFGIAKATQARLTEKTLFTEHHQMIGTPQYMSPEQAEMSGLDIDTRSDVYSLGVLLYELLTGTTPLDAVELRSQAYGEMQRIIREVEPPSPSTRLSTMGKMLPTITAQRRTDAKQLGRVLRGEVDWIIMRCLEKDRTRRYESASGLTADVMHYLADEPVLAGKPSAMYRAHKFVRRYRLQVAAAAVLAVSLLAGISVSTIGMVRAIRAEQQVRQQKDALAQERDRVVAAEKLEQEQRKSAESAARQARLQYADGLISQGDALVSIKDYFNAYARYATAQKELQTLGGSLSRLDLSLVRLYRTSPPPLWSVTVPGGEVHAWAVLRDRRQILVAGGDKQFHLLDLLTGQTIREFGSTKGVKSMATAVTSDGPPVVIAGLKFVRVIDPVTGAGIREAADDRAMHDCALSPDGTLAASIDQAGAVIFWETATMKKLGEGNGSTPIDRAVFSHDGKTVATTGNDLTIAFWNPRNAKLVKTLGLSLSPCTHIAFGEGDKTLFCGTLGGSIAKVDLETGQIAVWKAHDRNLMSVVAADKRVISSAKDGLVRVFASPSKENILTPPVSLVNEYARRVSVEYVPDTGPKAGPGTLACAAGDQGVVVGVDGDGGVYAWPLDYPWRHASTLHGGLALSRDGLLLAGSSNDQTEIRDAATGHTLRIFKCSGFSNSNVFSSDGQVLFASRDDGNIHALDLANSRCLWAVQAHSKGPWSMDTSADGSLIASGGTDGTARIFDARTGRLVRSLPGHGNDVRAVLFVSPTTSPARRSADTQPSFEDKHLIVACGTTGTIRDWDLASRDHPRQISMNGGIKGLSVSSDGKLFAVATNNHTIPFYDTSTVRLTSSLGPIALTQFTIGFIDPGDGPESWIVSASNELHCWDRRTGQDVMVLDAHVNDIASNMRISPDGTVIYAQDAGRINMKWPAQYRKLLHESSPVSRAAWYAEWGLWNWTRELLEREHAAGRDVPALLLARARWMCGDAEGGRRAFQLAVARQEIPASYAELCMSAIDQPATIRPGEHGPREPDIFPALAASTSLPDDIHSASDLETLKTLIGKETTSVEGVVATSLWSRRGKHLEITFEGAEAGQVGLLCELSAKEREEFDTAIEGDAAAAFAGARLRIHGEIESYDGKKPELKGWPQIKLKDPKQVTIIK